MEFIISLILLFRIRARLPQEEVEKWYKPLTYGLVACAVLLVLKTTSPLGGFIQWVGFGIMGALFYGIYKIPAFASERFIMISVLPLAAVNVVAEFLSLVLSGFYNSIEDYLDIAEGFAIVWMIGSFILYRRQRKQLETERMLREKEAIENKVNLARKAELEALVQERTRELSEQNETLQQTLRDLSAAQAQLIHSEKMASLGQLMAGIAHEIKNPLNFVNNFSDVNTELTEELVEALKQDHKQEALDLAMAIRENEQKIANHGKRADSIVRSMLQHSRSGTGKREMVEINSLADECLRLSYHGLRAREKTFNARMEAILDPAVGEVEVIPEEMNRVFLNICTNAFYAVHQRALQHEEGYHPSVWIETRGLDDRVEVEIRDNGPGIPNEVMDKIFQPFFTTKPTGEGTGLGLSMSYDIVTKGHNGLLRVESKEGEGTRFIISIPRKNQVILNPG